MDGFFLGGACVLPVQCSPQLLASTMLVAFSLASSPFIFFFFFWGPARVFVFCLRLRSTKVDGHPLLHLGRVHASASSRLALISPARLSLSLSLLFFFFFSFSCFFFLFFFSLSLSSLLQLA